MKQESTCRGRILRFLAMLVCALALASGIGMGSKEVMAATGTVADPIVLTPGTSFYSGYGHGEIWLKFTIPTAGSVACTLSYSDYHLVDIDLYTEDLGWKLYNHYKNDRTHNCSWVLSAGTYYIRFDIRANQDINYLTRVVFNSYGTNNQTAVSQSSPMILSLNQTVIGGITRTNTEQWYKISLPYNGKYSFTWTRSMDRSYFTFYNSSMQQIAQKYYYWVTDYGGNGYGSSFDLTLDAATYYIRVSTQDNYYGRYTFVVKRVGASDNTSTTTPTPTPKPTTTVTKPAATTLTSLTNISSGIRLNWKEVSGVSGYLIYRKSGNSAYHFVATVANASTTTFTDTSVKSKNGTGYTYKVYTYKDKTSGSASNTKYTIRMTPVKITSVKNAKGRKAVVKWTRNTKASGYQIKYSTSSRFPSSSTKYITVKSGSSCWKAISKLTKGKTYYICVRDYKLKNGKYKYYSGWSATKSVKITK